MLKKQTKIQMLLDNIVEPILILSRTKDVSKTIETYENRIEYIYFLNFLFLGGKFSYLI